MKKLSLTVAAVLSSGGALADVGDWKVPNWTTIVTAPLPER